MKTFFQKHKILIISMAIVLCFGMFSGLVIGGAVRLSMQSRPLMTVAEAKEAGQEPGKQAEGERSDSDDVREAQDRLYELGYLDKSSDVAPVPTPTDPAPVLTPLPANKPMTLSTQEISRITQDVQMRRQKYIIPVRSRYAPEENRFLWTSDTPDAELTAAARSAAEKLTETLFGVSFEKLTGCRTEDASVVRFTDSYGDRDAILRVQDTGGTYLLTLRAEDQRLICADLLTFPEYEGSYRDKENVALAKELGYAAKHYRQDQGTDHEVIYQYKTDTDVCLTFAYIGDKLWQVAVFPSEQAMFESEYFLADVQYDYSTPAYPENFVKADPPKGKGVLSELKIFAALTRLYRNLSGEDLDTRNMKATFYRDESGAREDCWKIEGGGFAITVSAYSGNIISFTGSIPCKDLKDVPYEQMGGEEYKAATEMIGRYWVTSIGTYGGDSHDKDVKSIDVNAVYDGHCCTMDIELEDGTWYECYFYDGVLKEMWYFANERMFYVGILTGWVANTVYVNAATGKNFIPDYRDWDGDLHVAQPGRN